ncbi:substrate-binding domain-containing protein [Pelotomaculum propionicicum]|uniref:Tungstate-binding protein TupA n=1 Tax=Pelotomaculum propionicicum TaxID=258475 RepID=A0A4Y7RRW5_9FIRM|nr:substrate-binding domain-containing protein [Pelotomaculum propionicicum]NLI11999.1 solute-binding protein [Peptococcaceae bacterium]TEB11449.1 Tungstate-binding protein TupA [Pelotomaculum propionicicum]
MKVKKFALPLVIALLVLVIGLIQGCGKQQATQQAPQPQVKDLILATTTSTQDSGLLDVLKPVFEQKTGYNLKIISVGSGAALEMGKKGEADVLLVHSPADEKALVDSGVGINYQLVMHNDFIIVGPASDPAAIKGSTAVEAFKKIADKKAIFVSRDDKSGTNTKELSIWKAAGITPEGAWYQKSGTGMGATLNITNEKGGYTLSDRATYLAQKNNFKLEILSEGDKSLLNIYHVMQVNPEKFSKVNKDGAKAFVDFMINPDTQKTIGEFKKETYGQSLFIPDAGKNEADLGK